MSSPMPVLTQVDVVVVGGGSGAVACAAALANAGRSTYVVAPRSYLGEDIAAVFDYWPRADDAFTTDLAKHVFPQGADPTATPPTPMHVKTTLEQALIDADVPFMFHSYPAGVLRDEAGAVRGVIIANRAGRQAIVASHVVDATERGLVAKQAGVTFTAMPTGEQTAKFVTLGADPIDDDHVTHEALPAMIAPGKKEPIEMPAHRYTLPVDLGDGSPAALARAYADTTNRCWKPGVWMHSETLQFESLDRVAGDRPSEWTGANTFVIDTLNVAEGLSLLGPAAVDPSIARTFARPAHRMAVGERLGESLEAVHTNVSIDALQPFCADSETISTGEVRSLPDALRPGKTAEQTLELNLSNLPRLGRWDVLVVGGGTGGASAGIGAARAGAKTLVCELGPALGGVGTLGQISNYYYGNIVGFTKEIDASVNELEAEPAVRESATFWTPPAKQAWYLRELRRLGADVWFGVTACGTWVEDGRVKGVVVAGPNGFGLLDAGAVVDSTGNADVAAAAGAETTGIAAEHVAVQGTGLTGLAPDQPYNNTDHNFSDDSDVVDATAFFVSSRRKFADFFDLGQLVDSRERRQIIGDIELGPADFLSDRRFPDSICLHSSNFDTHGYTVHPLFTVKPPDKERMWVYVPFRCLTPRGLDRVLVTGLGVSAHRDAIPVIRMQACVQNQGYAAGRAAAMAVEADVPIREIDVKALQKHLVEIGNLPDNVLTDEDTFPVSDQKIRWAVEEGWDAYLGIALCFDDPQRSQPLLRDAHDQATDPAQKQRYALILALMNDAHGEATLRDALAERSWDEGWNYRGMGQFGMSVSEVDALLLGLGAVGDADAWPIVLQKIEQLDADPDFSHCRAVAEACEKLHTRHPSPDAAVRLEALLDRPGMTGHAQTTLAEAEAQLTDNKNENDVRNRALRELHLARAVFRLGDPTGRGEKILARYARDLRGHFARHARAVMRQRQPATV